jgi:hypothetical protein
MRFQIDPVLGIEMWHPRRKALNLKARTRALHFADELDAERCGVSTPASSAQNHQGL